MGVLKLEEVGGQIEAIQKRNFDFLDKDNLLVPKKFKKIMNGKVHQSH